jgi:RNA polymerase sigma factor (sigma-70 family)
MLFSPTRTGYDNLLHEGFSPENKAPFSTDHPAIFHCGDVMYDNSLFFKEIAAERSKVLDEYNLNGKAFILATIHRNNNTDDPERLTAIFSALEQIATENKLPVVLPLHPRTSKMLEQNLNEHLLQKIQANPYIQLVPPVSFLDMIQLESHCQMVVTDSGGVQKEAYFFKKPCIILRPETEWTEIVDAGSGVIADADEKKIIDTYHHLMEKAEETDIHTSLRSYLYRAVIHTCLNHLKHDKVKEEYALEFRIRLLEDEQKRLEERGDVLMMEKELLLQVQQVVASLPEKNKKIFEMSRFGGLSHREIAEKMNISVRTVETQIYRALKTLYRELKDFRGS